MNTGIESEAEVIARAQKLLHK